MGFSLLDYFSGNFSPSTQQVNEAAKYADDMYAQQSGGADIHNADYVKQMNEEAQRGNILNSAALNEYNSQQGSVNHIAFPGSTPTPQGQRGGVVPPSYGAAGIGRYG